MTCGDFTILILTGLKATLSLLRTINLQHYNCGFYAKTFLEEDEDGLFVLDTFDSNKTERKLPGNKEVCKERRNERKEGGGRRRHLVKSNENKPSSGRKTKRETERGWGWYATRRVLCCWPLSLSLALFLLLFMFRILSIWFFLSNMWSCIQLYLRIS